MQRPLWTQQVLAANTQHFPHLTSPWLDVWRSSQPASWHGDTSYWTTSTEQDFGAKMAAAWWQKGQSVGTYTHWRGERQTAFWHRSRLFVITELWHRVDTRRSGLNSKEQQSIWMLPKFQTTFAAFTPGWKWLFFMAAAFLFTRQQVCSNSLLHFLFISVQTVHKGLHYSCTCFSLCPFF